MKLEDTFPENPVKLCEDFLQPKLNMVDRQSLMHGVWIWILEFVCMAALTCVIFYF